MADSIKVEVVYAKPDRQDVIALSLPVGASVRQAIEASGLGLNPIVEPKQVRLVIPALSNERRQQLSARVKKLGEETKVILRNGRRDANKHAEALSNQPGVHVPEDEIETLKEEIQSLLKKYEEDVDKRVDEKTKEIMQI